MEIIPAIDIIDGKCVRLTEGDYATKTVYSASPLEMAIQYEQLGFKRIHVVDLDGAKAGKVINWKVLEAISSNTKLKIDFGGGIKTEEEVKRVLDHGIQYVTVGSIAANNPIIFREWLDKFGAHQFFLGADVKDNKIMTGGWLNQTAIDVIDFIDGYLHEGIHYFFCTDISRDGKLLGPSIQLYEQIIQEFPSIQLVASGGVSSLDDLSELHRIGCAGAIVGKAIYEGKINLKDLAAYNN